MTLLLALKLDVLYSNQRIYERLRTIDYFYAFYLMLYTTFILVNSLSELT